jgi:protein SCO1/2
MLRLAAILFVLIAGAVMSTTARAHSLDELEGQLTKQEVYFLAVSRPAPGFTLQDSDGKPHALSDWKSKVVILWFIYTNCPDVCPLHTDKMAAIQKMINRTPMKDRVEFIAVTTDPERDSGAVLRDYGATHGLDSVNAVLLTSGADKPTATRELAEAYGLKFTQTPDGMQMHGIVTHVIDKSGNLRARYHGLKFAPTNLLVYVNALTNDYH